MESERVEAAKKQGLILAAILSPAVAATLLIAGVALLSGLMPVPSQGMASVAAAKADSGGDYGR